MKSSSRLNSSFLGALGARLLLNDLSGVAYLFLDMDIVSVLTGFLADDVLLGEALEEICAVAAGDGIMDFDVKLDTIPQGQRIELVPVRDDLS